MSNSKTIISNFEPELENLIDSWKSEDIFILVDENTKRECYPSLLHVEKLKSSHLITVKAGDEHKNIDSVLGVWKYLTENGANRNSLMINLGGGMVTDLGGFAASTFKRGIKYINIATTLLGAVDAATGGKTGINFLGYKNEIGVFNPSFATIIDIHFFRTLDAQNIRSGYAEMIKHALLDSENSLNEILQFDWEKINWAELKNILEKNIQVKENIVENDPKELGLRKALNLGHTFGHALESLSHRKKSPVLHGYAVAWGLVCELYLSLMKLQFPKDKFLKISYYIKDVFGQPNYDCNDYETIYELMTHDKKNDADGINFTLLSDVGKIVLNQHATKDEIFECLDILL